MFYLKTLSRVAAMPEPSNPTYDAILLLSFGGPEGPDEVMPFLENVVQGKNVPRERLIDVARHYELFDGISPLNSENRSLLAALVAELNAHGSRLPVYWGNRNWHPLLTDTLQQMTEDGVQHALAFVTSAFGSYPGCRQYLEDIEHARQAVGPQSPRITKLRLFYNHPGFIEPMAQRVADALCRLPADRQAAARVVFTAHSIPVALADRSPYQHQLREACQLVVECVKPLVASQLRSPLPKGEGQSEGLSAWDLVFQSRSGPPSQPWLKPDIGDHLRQLAAAGEVEDVIVVPIGFLAEHMEVVYDLDVELHALCGELELNMVRAEVVGSHPRFVGMIRELILERMDPSTPRLALGNDGPSPDDCPADCCR